MVRVPTLANRLLSVACAAGLAASLLLVASGALAQAVVINNGLAPPNPDNVLDGSIDYSANRLRIRNVGCPPGWPAVGVDPDDPCPSPGAPTTAAIEAGGEMLIVIGYDSSIIQMNGGLVTVRAEASHSSSLEITGGAIADRVDAYDDALVTMSGGSVELLFSHDNASITLSGGSVLPSATPTLLAGEDSVLTVVGTGFEVDGVPVPYGDLADNLGVLTGTLLAGDALDAIFRQGSPTYPGTITLAPDLSTTICSDGLDNDADGLTDYPNDPGCAAADDLSERDPTLVCDDGADNDGDGLIDYPDDPGCLHPAGNIEDPECQDGISNDGDGLIDFDGGASAGLPPASQTAPDPSCVYGWRDREESCGLGAELALLLPPLMWLSRRRRRSLH